MIRSLAAIIVAVLAGFTIVKMIEGGGAAVLGAETQSAGYGALLAGGWFAGAFVAAFIAMFIGKRWAPLGGLGAASILLSAILTLMSNPLSWLMWPAAIIATAAGGYGAIRLTNAPMTHPDLTRKDGLFDG